MSLFNKKLQSKTVNYSLQKRIYTLWKNIKLSFLLNILFSRTLIFSKVHNNKLRIWRPFSGVGLHPKHPILLVLRIFLLLRWLHGPILVPSWRINIDLYIQCLNKLIFLELLAFCIKNNLENFSKTEHK